MHSASPEVSRDRGRRDVNFVKFSGRNRRCESHRGALLIPMAAAPASLGAADPPAAQPGFASTAASPTFTTTTRARSSRDRRRARRSPRRRGRTPLELSHALHESTGLTKYLMRFAASPRETVCVPRRPLPAGVARPPGSPRLCPGATDLADARTASSRAPGWIHAIGSAPTRGL